jgi:ADP-ribosylglycohydrolase
MSIVFYLCYLYHDDPKKALLQNVMLGGHSTSRGAVLGAILGAAHPDQIPFLQDLAAYSHVQKEVQTLVDTI